MKMKVYPAMKYIIAGGMLFLGGGVSKAQTYLIQENFDAFPSGNPALPNQGWKNTIITGNAGTDQWVFNNPAGRGFSNPISGKFALFDSDYFSQGGGPENVALESPAFSTIGYSVIRLQFDQYFDGVYLNTDSIVVEIFNGSTWIPVYSYNGFASISNSMNLDVTSMLANTTNAQVRFRFVGDWSFYWMVDNVRVLGLHDYDATVVQASFVSGVCGSTADSVVVEVANTGLQTIGNFTVRANLAGMLGGNPVNSSVSGVYSPSLAPGAKGTLKLPAFSTAAGGSGVLKAYTELATEENLANDTFTSTTISFLGIPSLPTVADDMRCGSGSVVLQVSGVASTDSIVWYEGPFSSVPIGSGTPFTTPATGPGNYSYYVSSGRGALKNALSTTYVSNNSQSGVMFDVAASRSILIDSFEVSIGAGTHQVEIYYKAGTYQGFETNPGAWTLLGTTTVISTQVNGGPGIYVNVGNTVILTAGNTYAFYIQLPNSTVINYTNATSLQNFSNSEIQITTGAGKGANFGATFSLRVFNGTIHYSYFPLCESQRQTVQVEVKTLPVGSALVAGSPFQGTFKAGTLSDPHVVANGDTVNLEILAPSFSNNAAFGSDWNISSIHLQSINGSTIPPTDTATFKPTANKNGRIRLVPSPAISDSLLHITATLSSMLTGCDSTLESFVYIAPRPQAHFTFAAGCDGVDVLFTNGSSIHSGTLSYEWSFGGGVFSTLENPSQLFPTHGTYEVILKVSSNLGYVDYDTQSVFVRPIPPTSFVAVNACEGSAVELTNTTTMPSGIPTFTWDFGDGNTANTQNAAHMYAVPGNYTVTYTVDVDGCSKTVNKLVTQAPRAVVDFSLFADCNNTVVVFTNHSTLLFGTMGYQWDFGDNTSSTQISPNHNYDGYGSFGIKLRAFTDLGCSDSFSAIVHVVQAPDITIAYSAPCAGERIVFTNNTIVPAGFSNTYIWSFGDGNTSADNAPGHTYPGIGTYTLSLHSFSTNGCSDSFQTTIQVNEKPNAGIVIPAVVCEGQNINFLNSTTSSNISAVSYFWDFNNGVTSRAKDTAFTYASPDNYSVQMIATIAGGCSDTAFSNVYVSALPSAEYTVNSMHTQDGTMEFFAAASGAGISYQWFFGDGAKATVAHPVHQYLLDGVYIARLVTKNADNCTNEKADTLYIYRTGLTDLKNGVEISLYPNPNQGQFMLGSEGADFSNFTLQVVNVLGQTIPFHVKTRTADRIELDLHKVGAGIYYLRIIDGYGGQKTLQFIVR